MGVATEDISLSAKFTRLLILNGATVLVGLVKYLTFLSKPAAAPFETAERKAVDHVLS